MIPDVASHPDSQLALTVDTVVHVTVLEQRAATARDLRVGPMGEPDARLLAALLLARDDVPAGHDGPWRAAVAGGTRTVRLER